MSPPILSDLLRRERQIAYRTPPPVGEPAFRYQPGHLPLLFSAPHATAHLRAGELKPEEEFTAALASHLAAHCGVHALFATHQAAEDPNYDRESRYKRYLARIIAEHGIRFVLDLHGMSNRHGMGVAVGTINGRSCPAQQTALVEAFTSSGFQSIAPEAVDNSEFPPVSRLVVDHLRFTGGRTAATVTRFVFEELGVPAAQLEIASSLRIVYRGANGRWGPFTGDPDAIQQLVQALTTFIQKRASGARQMPL